MIRLYCKTCGLFAELDDYKSRKRTVMSAATGNGGVVCRCGCVTAYLISEGDAPPGPYSPHEDE
jgi:hypothetical protein